jgi:hypothetical protein
MKRPYQVYLIAIWLVISSSLHIGLILGGVVFGLLKVPQENSLDSKNWIALVLFPTLLFFAFVLTRLIQLRGLGIFTSIILLMVACIHPFLVLSASIAAILSSPKSTFIPLLPPVAKQLLLLMVNFLCIWYLGRRRFRNHCRTFVQEKHRESLQRRTEGNFYKIGYKLGHSLAKLNNWLKGI